MVRAAPSAHGRPWGRRRPRGRPWGHHARDRPRHGPARGPTRGSTRAVAPRAGAGRASVAACPVTVRRAGSRAPWPRGRSIGALWASWPPWARVAACRGLVSGWARHGPPGRLRAIVRAPAACRGAVCRERMGACRCRAAMGGRACRALAACPAVGIMGGCRTMGAGWAVTMLCACLPAVRRPARGARCTRHGRGVGAVSREGAQGHRVSTDEIWPSNFGEDHGPDLGRLGADQCAVLAPIGGCLYDRPSLIRTVKITLE